MYQVTLVTLFVLHNKEANMPVGNIGIETLKGNLTNPARTFMWQIHIAVPIGGGASSTYTLRAQSTMMPGRGTDEITIPFMQTAGIVVAGKLTYPHKWACTFIEGEDQLVFQAIYGWAQNIINDQFGVNPGSGDPSYKTDMNLTLLTTAGNIYQKTKLKGVWIQNVADIGLTYAAGDGTIKYPVSFTYDYWYDNT